MKIFTVDTFTNKPFSGNPAGVCILDKNIDDSLMLKIAREINFSETAFVQTEKVDGQFNLRWFTPSHEIDLCGHATLATAKIMYELEVVDKSKMIEFATRSGTLTAKLTGNKIEMDFPSKNITPSNSDSIINSFVKTAPKFVGIDGVWCLIELDDEAVRTINPDLELMKTHNQKIFVFTAKSENEEYDFVSRCFGPSLGINEDPVTGSAHCYLSKYWGKKLNKKKLIGMQASERTGIVECELIDNERVLLFGESIIMSEIKQNWDSE